MSEFFSETLGRTTVKSNGFVDWSKMMQDQAAARGAAWSLPEAFFCVLLAAATCDDEVTRAEQETLITLVHRSPALKGLTDAELQVVNTSVSARLADAEQDVLANACAAIPPEMRLGLFAHALDIVLCDGELKKKEADFLNAIVAGLSLDRSEVERVAEVLILKNRY